MEIVKIDYLKVKKAALILRALNHKMRQQMILLLEEKDNLTVTEIYAHMRLEQSAASQHLAILRRAGIVKTKRDGKFMYYSVNGSRLQEIQSFIDQLLK